MARPTVVALLALLCAAATLSSVAADAATATIEFDNRVKRVIAGSKRQAVLDALAESVFMVPRGQVQVVSGLDQSGVLNAQSVVTFRAQGPTTNRRPVYQNCVDDTKGFLFFDSAAKKAVKKATDTWWPGDKVDVKKASCNRA